MSFDESRRGGSYELANVGESDLAEWKLTFQVPDGRVVSVEPGTWDQSGDTTTVTGGPIPAGTTITVRVVTRGHDGSPENCTVNGVPC